MLFLLILSILALDSNHHDNHANWECGNNTYRLKIIHRTFSKQQRNRQQNQKNAPHKLNSLIRLFAIFQFVIAIARSRQRNRIKGSCIEGNHRQKHNHHNDRCERHCFYNAYNHSVKVTISQILCNKLSLSSDLHSHRIVTKYDKTRQRRADTKYMR